MFYHTAILPDSGKESMVFLIEYLYSFFKNFFLREHDVWH